MEEHEFGDELAKLFTVQDGVIVRTVFDIVDFNEKALDLMEGLLKGRVERKRQENAERGRQALYEVRRNTTLQSMTTATAAEEVPGTGKCKHHKPMTEECRHCWYERGETRCYQECQFHQIHGPDGTPTDYDGNPVSVNQPYRYCHSAVKIGAPRCNDTDCEVCS